MTKLLFLDDTYLFECGSRVVSCEKDNEKPNAWAVILSCTLFYPQGGGQPADTGEIRSPLTTFSVTEVKMKEDHVLHIGTFCSGPFFAGDQVALYLNEPRRRQHARLHSAGHLLDSAVSGLGLNLVPGKGFHFPESPYVEYLGELAPEKREDIKGKLTAETNRMVAMGGAVEVISTNDEAVVKAKCGSVPDYLQKKSDIRIVTVFGNLGCPCGGTHVKDISEIGAVSVTKIQKKGPNVRIYYTVTTK